MKDNTEKLMAAEKWEYRTTFKKIVTIFMILVAALWIYSVAHPEANVWKRVIFGTKTVEKKDVETNKEIVMIEKTGSYVALFSDGTYVTADDISEFAEKLSEATGKTYASELGKLKVIDGGAIMTVEITEYKK